MIVMQGQENYAPEPSRGRSRCGLDDDAAARSIVDLQSRLASFGLLLGSVRGGDGDGSDEAAFAGMRREDAEETAACFSRRHLDRPRHDGGTPATPPTISSSSLSISRGAGGGVGKSNDPAGGMMGVAGSSSGSKAAMLETAAANMSAPFYSTPDTVSSTAQTILNNIVTTMKELTDSRLRSMLSQLAQRKGGISNSPVLLRLLNPSRNPIRVATVITRFEKDHEYVTDDVPGSADGMLSVPLRFKAVLDIKVFGEVTTVELSAPVSLSGRFDEIDGLLTAVDVCFDCVDLLKTMIVQARSVVKLAVTKAVALGAKIAEWHAREEKASAAGSSTQSLHVLMGSAISLDSLNFMAAALHGSEKKASSLTPVERASAASLLGLLGSTASLDSLNHHTAIYPSKANASGFQSQFGSTASLDSLNYQAALYANKNNASSLTHNASASAFSALMANAASLDSLNSMIPLYVSEKCSSSLMRNASSSAFSSLIDSGISPDSPHPQTAPSSLWTSISPLSNLSNITNKFITPNQERARSKGLLRMSRFRSNTRNPNCTSDGGLVKRRKKSVQFSPNVSLRYSINNASDIEPPMDLNEIQNNMSRVKTLSKAHYHMRSQNNAWDRGTSEGLSSSIGDAIRYEIKGESLRGMERITDLINGRKRQGAKEEAIRSAVMEQQEQLIQAVLDSKTADEARMRAVKIDTGKLAKSYGAKTQEALEYAKQVARADAEVAAAILAEDLKPEHTSMTRGHATDSVTLVTGDPWAATTLVKPFLVQNQRPSFDLYT